MDATTATTKVQKPSLHRVPVEYMGGYTFSLTDAYGETRKYMVRKDLQNPAWGWNVYKTSLLDAYRWELVIDQMSTRDQAMKVAVADSLATGTSYISSSHIEWEEPMTPDTSSQPTTTPKETPMNQTSDLVKCPGIPSFSVPAHDAPRADFSQNRKRPNGLAVLCRTHDTLYQRTWQLAKAAGMKAADYVAANGLPEPADRRRKAAPVTEPVVVDGTAAQAAELDALEADLQAAGGAGTDQGQALLAEAAEAEAAARAAARREARNIAQRARRAAAKAAAAQA